MRSVSYSLQEASKLHFDDFYRASYRKVFASALAFSGRTDTAADATQEAFVRAFSRWNRLQKEPWVEGWVMTTAMNLCKAALRSKRLSITGRGSVRAQDPPTADRLDVVGALRQLAPRQRTAVILHYLGDLPLPEVSRLMNVSEGTVKAHLAQARRRLRPLLEVSDA